MPITLDWYDDNQTIILIRFFGDWTMEEYAICGTGVETLLQDNRQHAIGLVIDASSAGATPKNALAGFKQTITEGKLPIAVINVRRDVRIMIDSLRRAYFSPRALYYANSIAEAVELLQEHQAQFGANQEVSTSY